MQEKELEKLGLRSIKSKESTCYFSDDRVFKVFNKGVDVKSRTDKISIFLEHDIKGVPQIYDFIYDESAIVGYIMKYYRNAIPLSGKMLFNFIKERCLDVVDLYLSLIQNYGICYYDFHNDNVLVNDKKILLLDVDSCLDKSDRVLKMSDQFLCDYVLGIIYSDVTFANSLYFGEDETNRVRELLYTRRNGEKIENALDLSLLLVEITKRDRNKVLRKVPRNFKN